MNSAAPITAPQRTHMGWAWSAGGDCGIEATEARALAQMRARQNMERMQ